MHMDSLGNTCMVTINFKDKKKRCMFFVVPGHSQVLLEMPDTAAVKIIINIDSIQATEEACNTNIGDAKEPNIKQDMHVAERSCTNMDADLKIDNKANSHSYADVNTLTNYFLSSPNIKANKRKSSKLT